MARPEKNYVQPCFEGYPTLHDLLDRETARHPERPYFLYTEDDKPDEIVRISMLELNRASHRAATEFSKMEGYDAKRRENVAFIAMLDTLVYTAAFYGTVRAGLVVSRALLHLSSESMQENLIRHFCLTAVLHVASSSHHSNRRSDPEVELHPYHNDAHSERPHRQGDLGDPGF